MLFRVDEDRAWAPKFQPGVGLHAPRLQYPDKIDLWGSREVSVVVVGK